jgi:hypothetical protein
VGAISTQKKHPASLIGRDISAIANRAADLS